MFGDTPPARNKASGLCLVLSSDFGLVEFENDCKQLVQWD